MVRAVERTFQELNRRGERAFIPFITAGDPDLDATVRLVPELASAGSDILELGIPFSEGNVFHVIPKPGSSLEKRPKRASHITSRVLVRT